MPYVISMFVYVCYANSLIIRDEIRIVNWLEFANERKGNFM